MPASEMPVMDRRSSVPVDELMKDIRACGGMYRLLGRSIEAEPDAELLALIRGDLRQPLAEAGVVFDEAFFGAQAENLLDALAAEYTCLFVAPGGVPPYASVFETGRMYQHQADRAGAAYRESGWVFEPRISGEFPDNLGTMLTFVGMLFDAEADALAAGAQDQADLVRDRRDRFLLEQIGPWAAGWCRRAGTVALHVFYREILRFAEQVIWYDVQQLAGRRKARELAALNSRPPVALDYDADFRKASGL